MDPSEYISSPLDSGAASQHEGPFYVVPPRALEIKTETTNNSLKLQPLMSFGGACDLVVELVNSECGAQYLVSSSVLQLVSEVWAKLVRPRGFADLTKVKIDGIEYPLLNLEDDDVECLTFLFKIFHFQQDDVPKVLTYPQLRKMAIVCDKYNCWSALKLWKEVWFNNLIRAAESPGYEDWLFIATQGSYTHPKIDALKLSLFQESGSLSSCKSYFIRHRDPESYTVSCEILPQAIINSIMSKRDLAVNDIIKRLREFTAMVSNVCQDHTDEETLCRDKNCRNIALGSLCESIKRMELWPLVQGSDSTPRTWHGSLRQLIDKVRSLKMTTIIPAPLSESRREQPNSSIAVVTPDPPGIAPESSLRKKRSRSSSCWIATTHPEIMERFKPEISGQRHECTMYDGPAFIGVNYENRPCETAFKLGGLFLDTQKAYCPDAL
ncbi:hypothetical protein TWF730_003661 [Orbilia blumenaviensis]|uniref:BTB domain-containing protein n=1 Tax=Orbilia blumenaviensis TaxID=1796055 RepID=A0AAV9U6A7_9PEZI